MSRRLPGGLSQAIAFETHGGWFGWSGRHDTFGRYRVGIGTRSGARHNERVSHLPRV